MKKSVSKVIRYLSFLALGIVLLFFAFRKVDFQEMISILSGAKYSWVALSLVFSIFAFISRAQRWSILIEPLGKKPGLWNTYNALLFGYLANYAFPRMGEVTRCIALNRKEKIPVDSLLGTVVVERAIDLISLLAIMLFLLIARFEKFGSFFQEQILDGIGEKVNGMTGNKALFLIILLVLTVFALIIVIFRKHLVRFKLFTLIRGFLNRLVAGLKSVLKMKKRWQFLAHTIFIWTNYALMTWVVFFALPDITGDLKFADAIFLLVIGSLGMAAPVQAGIGAFHWIVSMGLITVYGIGETEALSFASLQHTSQTLLVFFLGALATIFLFTRIGNKRNTKDEAHTS